jgi:hypothetical protein
VRGEVSSEILLEGRREGQRGALGDRRSRSTLHARGEQREQAFYGERDLAGGRSSFDEDEVLCRR